MMRFYTIYGVIVHLEQAIFFLFGLLFHLNVTENRELCR